MSIIDEIKNLEYDGKLTRFDPETRGRLKRRLFLCEEARNELNKTDSAVNLLVGKGFLIAAFMRWVTGGLIYGEKGKKGKFLCRLDKPPDEIWEIRVTDPSVQARLFVRFAYQNTLILTNMHTRTHLGKKGSLNWGAAMRRCEKTWNELFPEIPAFTGNKVSDYITENCDDFKL